jgi:hypothetical protein
MTRTPVQTPERRVARRWAPTREIRVTRAIPVVPLSDARVLNTSTSGVAIATCVPLHPGERLSFHIEARTPPILAEVLAAEPLDGQLYRIRCRCLLGGFEDC